MNPSSASILLVDDFEPFRRLLRSTLQSKLEFETIVEALDGVEAVELAQSLQPDLILLDIGLPKLNGIEAARRIREVSPRSKILFVSQEYSLDFVQAAFSVGAAGYVVKMDAGNELATAVKAVLRGDRFVGSRFAGHSFNAASDTLTAGSASGSKIVNLPQPQNIDTARRHQAEFYSEEASLLAGFTLFIGAALRAGNSVIVLATESHRESLLPRLQADGLDIAAVIEQGRYISLDPTETLATFMVNGVPDPVRFFDVTGDLLLNAAKAAKAENARVAACGEGTSLLWVQGNPEAAIRLEHLWNEMAKSYDVDVFCGYSLASCEGGMDCHMLEKICALHSAVRSR